MNTNNQLNSIKIWEAINYPSKENCRVSVVQNGYSIHSVIAGIYQDNPFKLEYHLELDKDWKTRVLEMHLIHGGNPHLWYFKSDGNGHWSNNMDTLPEFNTCVDVDISITPLTNTLPIRRLQLKQGDKKEIHVVYFDFDEKDFKVLKQQYTRLSDTKYHYQNIPNDFEAVITVDADGFVVNYPGLFRRLNKQGQ